MKLRQVTKEQARDAGMAFVLILLIAWYFTGRNTLIAVAAALHVINMTAPSVFRLPAALWFGMSHALGQVVSRVILTIVYFFVVTPMAAWRRMIGADSLQLRAFKSSSASVMQERNYRYSGKDLEQPY